MSVNDCFYVYFIECSGGVTKQSIYIGSTMDVEERYRRHASGRAALYTKTHPPVRLITTLRYPTRAQAVRVEKALKRLSPRWKKEWVDLLAILCPFCEAHGKKVTAALADGEISVEVEELADLLNSLEKPLQARTQEVFSIACPGCSRVAPVG